MSPRAASEEIIEGIAALSVGDPKTPLPGGWCRVRLTEVARLESGHTPSRKHPEYWDGDIPWVSLPDARVHHGGVICETTQHTNELGLANSAARLLPADTVCLSRTASVGYVFRLGRPMATSQDFVNWVCSDALDPRFLMYALIAEGDHILNFGKGSTHTTIYFPEVLAFQIALPPLPEQHRIVEKVEAMLARLHSANAILERVRSLDLTAAVVSAACSGLLTTDLHSGDTEAAPEVFSDFVQEIRSRTPASWRLVRFADLCDHMTSGSRAWKKYYTDDGYGTFVMAQNVRPMSFDRNYRQGVAPPANDPELKRTRIRENDLLITIVGANTGDVCRVDAPVENHFVCQSVALARPKNAFLSRFLELWLNSPAHGRAQYEQWMYGEGRPHLSFDHLRNTIVALPPEDEQVEILRRADALFSLLARIRNRLTAARDRAARLQSAVLRKAFAGELVPTEAELARREARTCEPASVLAGQIDAERERSAPQRR